MIANTPSVELIAACGLYCGACPRYTKGKCPGCAKYDKATWCGVRKCCREHGYLSCADCTLMPLEECRKFNNFMAKIFGFIFRSDRHGCIRRLREAGPEQFVKEMHAARCCNRPQG